MRFKIWLALLVCLVASAGCAGPRFVHVDGDGGVIAMPDYSNSWPSYYRDNADKMLRARFPKGYTIEKEEEVVVGATVHTTGNSRTDEAPTFMLGGGEDRTTKSGNRTNSAGSFAGLAVPVGPTRQNVDQTTTTTNQTEWRIYFKANK